MDRKFSITRACNALNKLANSDQYLITTAKIRRLGGLTKSSTDRKIELKLIGNKYLIEEPQYNLLRDKLSKFRSKKKRNKIISINEIAIQLKTNVSYISKLIKEYNSYHTVKITNYDDWKFVQVSYYKTNTVQTIRNFKKSPKKRWLTIKNSEAVIPIDKN